jgi:hypothetical protein
MDLRARYLTKRQRARMHSPRHRLLPMLPGGNLISVAGVKIRWSPSSCSRTAGANVPFLINPTPAGLDTAAVAGYLSKTDPLGAAHDPPTVC